MLGVWGSQQLPVQPIGPGMIGAGYLGGAALSAEQFVRPMLADIVERAKRALAIPDDRDRLAGDFDRDEGARLPQFLGVADPLPRLRDDFLQINLMPMRVCVGLGAERQRPAWIRIISVADGCELLPGRVLPHCNLPHVVRERFALTGPV